MYRNIADRLESLIVVSQVMVNYAVAAVLASSVMRFRQDFARYVFYIRTDAFSFAETREKKDDGITKAATLRGLTK